jgi:NHL repeat
MRGTGINRLIMLLMILLLPLHAAAAEAIKYKFALSLYADEKGNGMNQPEGIACSESRITVADSGNGRLISYSIQGGQPKGGTEIRLTQMLYPIRVKLTSTGEILVLDERLRKVLRLTKDGAFMGYLELSGVPTEDMIVPAGIDIDGKDNIYLLDVLGGRALVFGGDGKFQRQIDFPKQYGFITDLTVDAKGTVFAIDGVKAMVYSAAADAAVFAPMTAKLKDDVKFGGNIATDNAGALYISDQNSGGVVVVGPDGVVRTRLLGLGWKEGSVRYPAQICFTGGGDFFIADKANSRIQKFSVVK